MTYREEIKMSLSLNVSYTEPILNTASNDEVVIPIIYFSSTDTDTVLSSELGEPVSFAASSPTGISSHIVKWLESPWNFLKGHFSSIGSVFQKGTAETDEESLA